MESALQPARSVLLAAVGNQTASTSYRLGDTSVEASHSTLAVFRLIRDRDNRNRETSWRALLLATSQTKENAERLADDLRKHGCEEVLVCEVQDEVSEEWPDHVLSELLQNLEAGDRVHLDLTPGRRHDQVALLFGLLALDASWERPLLAGIYYNRPGPDGSYFQLEEILSLKNMAQIFYALKALKKRGDTGPLMECTEFDGDLSKWLSRVQIAFASGLPLELGLLYGNTNNWQQLVKGLTEVGPQAFGRMIQEIIEQIKHEAALDLSQIDRKGSLPLERQELERQAGVIDLLLERGHAAAAIGLLREWIINWTLFILEKDRGDWLNRKTRWQAERRLGLLNYAIDRKDKAETWGLLGEDGRRLAEFWRDLCGLRNSLHHHGMMNRDLNHKGDGLLESLKRLQKQWSGENGIRAWLLGDPQPEPFLCRQNKLVLVSPVGTPAGALYTALLRCREDPRFGCPDVLLLIGSEMSLAGAEAARRRAGFDGEVLEWRIRDVFGGPEEIRTVPPDFQEAVARANRVLLNLTGGTTLLSLAVEKIRSFAREWGQDPIRFGVFDRRSREAQQEAPFVCGEWYLLDEVVSS